MRKITETPVAEEQVQSEAVDQDAPAPKARGKKLKHYKITFHGEGGDVEIGHNYKMNLYKRNVESVIDENYLDVLRHSVNMTQTQDANGNWQKVSIPAHSYTLGEEV